MKRAILLLFLMIIFTTATIAFTIVSFEDFDIAYIPPILICLIAAIIFISLFFIEVFLGHKMYCCNGTHLYVNRNGKCVLEVLKPDISNLIVVRDIITKEHHMISFVYHNKRHYIVISPENKENIIKYIDGIPFQEKNNLWYYIIELFII